jgi:hypothetical protein
MARMTGLRQTAKSGAGLHNPGSRSLSAHLFHAPRQLETGQNLNGRVCEKFFKKSFENPKVSKIGADNDPDTR